MSKLQALGLPDDAVPEEIEARYEELSTFLRSHVPANLQAWAKRQLALLDEAYASLDSDEPAGRDARMDTPPPAGAQPKRRAATQEHRAARGQRPARPKTPALRAPGLAGRALAGAAAGLVLLAVIAGVFYVRGRGGDEAPADVPSVAGAAAEIDQARVAELKGILQEQPENLDALFELGEMYFTAGDMEAAIEWFSKVVALDPEDTHALTDLGTANFNLGRPGEAKTYWERVLAIDPEDVQAHYNLGFYHANVEPVDMEAAVREWERVIELDPNSPQAQTARVHIDGLQGEQAAPQAPEGETP